MASEYRRGTFNRYVLILNRLIFESKQMLKQKAGNVVSITAALADEPTAGINASVSLCTKGGLNAVTRSLAIEYARKDIRLNAVAFGTVDTPSHKDAPRKL
jgi:NAD(P)-dependent dehydrogenase (short-subunit alcohol dehydrogenase family)